MRKEVPAAVAECKKAGITVRMVTGDNILTAKKIAEEWYHGTQNHDPFAARWVGWVRLL